MFYGGPGSELQAIKSGATLIRDTPGGAILNQIKFPNGVISDAYWGPASAKYATQASGTPVFFIERARPDRIFYQWELPALRRNTNVILPPSLK